MTSIQESKSHPIGAIDPEAMIALKSLELRVRAVMEGVQSGLHRSRRHGLSVEFAEYRHYLPGDDPKHLDWKLYARSDRYFIKQFQEETNLDCMLMLDRSRSMEYSSRVVTKSDYAVTLVATLAHFLTNQRESVGLLTFSDSVNQFLPARNRTGHLRQMFALLERSAPDPQTDLSRPLEHIAERLCRKGMVVLVSDLLASLDGWESRLATLRATGQEVFVLQILDPAEIEFPFERSAHFRDVESGEQVHVAPANYRETYLRRFAEHQAKVRAICSGLGVELRTLRTDEPLSESLSAFLRERRNGM